MPARTDLPLGVSLLLIRIERALVALGRLVGDQESAKKISAEVLLLAESAARVSR